MTISPPPIANAQCIKGGSLSGKTSLLVKRVHSLVAHNTPPGDILFVCASHTHAISVAPLLPNGVAIRTPQELACAILDKQAPRSYILEPFEEQLLFEDLRTTGLPQKPLRKILGFILASQASLADWNDEWIEMHEERLVYDTLQDVLRFTQGVHPAEASNYAARTLVEHDNLRTHFGHAHVFVDDYGLLNRASQFLCNLLAFENLTVAGDPTNTAFAQDPFPYPDGIAELGTFQPSASFYELKHAPPQIDEETRTFNTVKEELEGICNLVSDLLAEGKDHQRIAVVGVNKRWLRNAAHALETHGIDVESVVRPLRAKGFDNEKTIAALTEDAKAKLAKNPNHGVALRTLLGMGDHLANSAELSRLRTGNPKTTLAQLVQEGAVEVPDAVCHSQSFLPEVRSGSFWKQTAEACQDRNTPPNQPSRWIPRSSQPSIAESELASKKAVVVAHPDDILGCHFDIVVFGGYLQGWLPALAYFNAVGKRKNLLLAQAHQSKDNAQRSCTNKMIRTYFKECDLEFAEHLGLHYTRIHMRNEARIVELLPFT